jgi:magnesium-transporting ATPase (P-type)
MDLEFLGLIIMENRLKPETHDVIVHLKEANIRTIMCTGDNILTALSVAHECEIIDSEHHVIRIEATSGQEIQFFYEESLKKNVTKLNSKPYDESNFVFAIDGKSFGVIRKENQEFFRQLALRGAVFARMSPDQKQQLIETLQEVGHFVGMW